MLNPNPRAVRLDTRKLHAALEARRIELGISARELIRQAGFAQPGMYAKLRRGGSISGDSVAALVHWLGDHDITPYLAEETT